MMRITFFCCLSLMLQMTHAQVRPATDDQYFIASGEAILRVQPDQVLLHVGVETRNRSLLEAKGANYAVITKVTPYCKERGIPDQHLQTDYLQIRPYAQRGNQININYYEVEQCLRIIIEDFSQYEDILTKLLILGINQVHHIEYRSTQMQKHRRQVRLMAIEAAKEKARFYSDTLGLALGKIVNANEFVSTPTPAFDPRNYANMVQNLVAEGVAAGDGAGLSAGLISVKATVNLTYALQTE
ncbi:MAG: SIMPL domain-containing protein [Bacteroidota bacterium]